jgi:hypothetical protein
MEIKFRVRYYINKSGRCEGAVTLILPVEDDEGIPSSLISPKTQVFGEGLKKYWGTIPEGGAHAEKTLYIEGATWEEVSSKAEETIKDAMETLKEVYQAWKQKVASKPQDKELVYVLD